MPDAPLASCEEVAPFRERVSAAHPVRIRNSTGPCCMQCTRGGEAGSGPCTQAPLRSSKRSWRCDRRDHSWPFCDPTKRSNPPMFTTVLAPNDSKPYPRRRRLHHVCWGLPPSPYPPAPPHTPLPPAPDFLIDCWGGGAPLHHPTASGTTQQPQWDAGIDMLPPGAADQKQ